MSLMCRGELRAQPGGVVPGEGNCIKDDIQVMYIIQWQWFFLCFLETLVVLKVLGKELE